MRKTPEGQPDVPLSELMLSPGHARPAEIVAYPSADGYGPGAISRGPVSKASPVAMLLRRKWMICCLFVLFAGGSVPCIWLLFAPAYRATAVVRISPVIEPIVFKNEKSGVLPFYQSYVNTEVSVIYSPTVLERVLDRAEVRQTEWFQQASRGGQTPVAAMLDGLQRSLSVSPRAGTELIDVSISTQKPRDSKTIVDIVVAEYRRLKEEMDKMSDTQLAETLTAEQATLQLEIDGMIKTRFNTASQLGTDAPEQLRSKLSQQLSDMESELHKLQRDLEMQDWQLKLEAQLATMPSEGPDRRYAADQTWQQLYFEVERSKSELAIARQQGGELNPRVRQAVAKAELAERLLRERQNQLDEGWRGGTGSGSVEARPRKVIEQRKEEIRRQIELLKRDLEAQQRKVKEAGDIAMEIANYDEKIRQKRELYEAVRSRRDVLEMEVKAPARVRVAAYATEPSSPSNDRRVMLTLLAVLGSMGASVTLGYVRSLADKRIYDARELQTMSQVPFLGLLPKLSAIHLPREIGGGVVVGGTSEDGLANARLMLMENMRMVRTTLLERVKQSGEKVVLITSSLPHTGKSSVAALLAQSLAVVGKKVLLVEADLRRPVLGERFGIEAKQGLAALLTGQAKHDEVIVRPEPARFDLLPAGEVPERFDPELLANGVFAGCMERWRKTYDFILLDSPPLLRVADAQILAGSVDGTIMVLRSSHDRRTETMEAFSQLSAVGGTLLGTVLIGGQFGPGYGHEYAYSYYTGYGKSYEYGRGQGHDIVVAGHGAENEA